MWINIKPNHMYNHSVKANCSSVTKDKVKYLVALSDIKKGDELLVDYTKDRDLEQPQNGWVE
jgi:SET domain-containing protein